MAEKKKTEKSELDLLMEDIQKKYGKNSIFKVNDLRPIPRVSSGSLRLDLAMGGGLPSGRIIEIYGEESSGKTWTALLMAKSFTHENLPVFWVDKEGTLDAFLVNDFFEINPNLFRIINTKSSEDDLQVVADILRRKLPCLIVIDSVPALIPTQEVDNGMGKAAVSGNAGLISKALRIFQSAMNMVDRNEDIRKIEKKQESEELITEIKGSELSDEDSEITNLEVENLEATVVMINQVRDNVGSYIGGLKTPGGRALKHFASIRIWVRRVEWIEESIGKDSNKNKVKIGQVIGAKIVKNKTAAPWREASYSIYFPPSTIKGIDSFAEVIFVAVEKNLIERKGTWFSFNGDSCGQGIEKTLEYFKANPEKYESLKLQLRNLLRIKL